MSVPYYYRRVPYSEFEEMRQRLRVGLDAADDWEGCRYEPPDREIAIEGVSELHYILNEGPSSHGGVYRNILGNARVGEHYDFLDPQEVKELKEALDQLTLEQLKSYCEQIAPGARRPWGNFDPALLWSAVEQLRPFLNEALFFSESVICDPD